MPKKHVVAAASEIPPGSRKLVSADGHPPAMYELSSDGLRRTSKGNLPAEVVLAFATL